MADIEAFTFDSVWPDGFAFKTTPAGKGPTNARARGAVVLGFEGAAAWFVAPGVLPEGCAVLAAGRLGGALCR